jgi:hypothetical protein
MNSSVCGRSVEGLIWCSILLYACRNWGCPRKTSVKIVGIMAEIQTGHLLNKSQKSYCLSHMLSKSLNELKLSCGLNALKYSWVIGCVEVKLVSSVLETVSTIRKWRKSSYFVSSYALKMEAACFSETLMPTYKVTWHHIPEETNLHCHCSENIEFLFFFPETDIRLVLTSVTLLL